MSDIVVVHNPGQSAYEVRVDGELAGSTHYRRASDSAVVDFTHTEIDSRFEGQGLGSRLVAGALDDLRWQGGRVIATCPFVAAYLKRHPEYADLVLGS